ncbi:MAG: Hpt domain-containing protein, partial [Planctomycetales bacterium]
MNDQDDLVMSFLVQSHEELDQVETDLVTLEATPGADEELARVFRTFHTIKGSCGFLGFKKLESIAHATEGLLSELRDGRLAADAGLISVVLRASDAIRQVLTNIERGGREGDEDNGPLIDMLRRLQSGEALHEVASGAASQSAEKTSAAGSRPNPPSVADLDKQPADAKAADDSDAAAEPSVERLNEIRGQAATDSAIRVDVALLDKLMNQVGELVLTCNQILQHDSASNDSDFAATCQHLNLVTTELQESVMKTRMQPIRNVWYKLPRIVRDLTLQCGKQVRLETEGEETELDKTLIEAISDPLTHLVRNAVDHGVEAPDRRVAAGKPADGRVRLRAFHESGQVIIQISDDGAGVDPAAIRARAEELGLLDAEQAARLSDREIINFVFLPGFSTAGEITRV